MTACMRSARGASEFTREDISFFHEPGEAISGFPSARDTQGHAWDMVIDELLHIRNLKDNWDGEGSVAPDPALVDGAITLVQSLKGSAWPPADRAVASVNGTVYLEWNTPLGYQEIEVTSPLDAEYRRVQKGAETVTVVGLVCRP